MSQNPSGGSVAQLLDWLGEYKRLQKKKEKGLTPSETEKFHELEKSLGKILDGHASQMNVDQRENLRVQTHLEVTFSNTQDFQKAYLKNISGGGLYIECQNSLPIGTVIDIQLTLPREEEPFFVQGEIAWTNPKFIKTMSPGIGVKFLNLNDTQAKKIQKLVSESIDKALERMKEKVKLK